MKIASFCLLLLYSLVINQGAAAFTVFEGTESIEINSKLNLRNAQLLQYAAKTGDFVQVETKSISQTILTQHRVTLQLDCAALLEKGSGNVTWTKLNMNQQGNIIDTEFVPVYPELVGEEVLSINGTRNSVLTIITSIFNYAGRTFNSHGVFRCEACSPRSCFTNSVTLFVVGGPPIIDTSGTRDFCLERPHSRSDAIKIKLQCDLLSKSNHSISPVVPHPGARWLFNGDIVFNEFDLDESFMMERDNFLFAPGLIFPQFLTLSGDYSLTFDLQAKNFSLVKMLNPNITESNIRENLFDLLLGSWACVRNNSYGTYNVTTEISELTGIFSFQATRLLVNESDTSVQACVYRTGCANSVRLYTTANNAESMVDYEERNEMVEINGDHECFQINILNDNIGEPVETFAIALAAVKPQVNVGFINRTLTIVIIDDDRSEEEMSCTINEYLLTDKVREEKEETVSRVLKLLPIDLPEVPASSDERSLESTYVQLAEHFKRPVSPEGQAKFTAAMDEIHQAFSKECSAGAPGSGAISELARSFKELTRHLSRITAENLAKARTIYGKFLCYNEREDESVARTKRQSEACKCPTEITTPCHFFECLNVSEMKTIIGFGNGEDGFPCIGFAVDTTGSMRDEIAAVRRVILQFIDTQANSTYCYLLVPFNDYGVGEELNIGPITHAFTSSGDKSLDAVTARELVNFQEAVNGLKADAGGDFPEYALGAMLAALEYSFIDLYGELFRPMDFNSELVVITDAASLQPELESNVTSKAVEQCVRIHFILTDHDHRGFASYDVYPRIANATNGTVYRDIHTTWSISKFFDELERTDRFKRSMSSGELSVSVSALTHHLRVTILTLGRVSDSASITLPNGTVETAIIQDSVMIYSKTSPLPGTYIFRIGTGTMIDEHLVREDVSMDVSFFYLDNHFTYSSSNPLPACTSGKIALTTSRIQEISSLSLNETGPDGSSRILPLTKCSNAFTADYHFRPGTFYYQIQGVDRNRVDFVYRVTKSATIAPSPSDAYTIRSKNSTGLEVRFGSPFQMEFEMRSRDTVASTRFTLAVNAEGFTTTLDPTSVELFSEQTKVITVTGRVSSTSVTVNRAYPITVTATNGCVTMRASRTVTQTPLPTIPPSESTTNECGCENGGTCIIIIRRGRKSRRCSCRPGFRGFRCNLSA